MCPATVGGALGVTSENGVPMSVRTPAGKLVTAFGNPAGMSRLYSPDVQWSLSASLTQFPRPIDGKKAVVAFNESIWRDVYRPDSATEILDEVGDDESSAVRFIYRATFVRSGTPYENEYSLFARSGSDGIFAVFEGLDTAALLDAMTGQPVGSSFRSTRTLTDD